MTNLMRCSCQEWQIPNSIMWKTMASAWNDLKTSKSICYQYAPIAELPKIRHLLSIICVKVASSLKRDCPIPPARLWTDADRHFVHHCARITYWNSLWDFFRKNMGKAGWKFSPVSTLEKIKSLDFCLNQKSRLFILDWDSSSSSGRKVRRQKFSIVRAVHSASQAPSVRNCTH